MDTERDFWYYAAILVSVLAMFAWALWVVTGIGGASVPWIAGLIFVLAIGSVGIRAWLKARSIVWTEEMKEAQKQRARQQARETLLQSIPWLVLSLGTFTIITLVRSAGLPQWIGAILNFALLAGDVWLWRIVNRTKV